MKRWLEKLAPYLIVLVMVGACWLLFRQMQKFQWDDIATAWRQLPTWKIWTVSGLAVLSYMTLMGYDYLAVRSIGHPLPVRKIAFGSFVGFAISYTFGALLGGSSVRYRLYSAWGLSVVEVIQLIAIVGITFWLGVFALGGVMFTIDPFEIPQLEGFHLPFKTVQPLGWMLIGLTLSYFLLTVLWRKPIKMYGHEVRLPGFRMSAMQVLIAALDFAIGALCMFVLLPSDFEIAYTRFLAIFILAWIAVVLSHVPGGIGVFDLIIIALVHDTRQSEVLVALAIYRVVYYLIPTLIALPMFFLHEATIKGSATHSLIVRMFGESSDAPSTIPKKR